MKKLKIAGLIISLAVAVFELIGSEIEDKKMEEAVSEEVEKQLTEREEAKKQPTKKTKKS